MSVLNTFSVYRFDSPSLIRKLDSYFGKFNRFDNENIKQKNMLLCRKHMLEGKDLQKYIAIKQI